jgi:hypothetical protein
LTQAYRLIGRLGSSQTLPGELSAIGLTVLNSLTKALRNRGVLLSALFQDSFTVVSGTASYTLAPRALSVSDVRYRPSGGVDTPLREVSRSEYLNVPNKAASGRPSQFYVDAQREATVLYLWPVPSNSVDAVHYSGEAVLDDLDATTDHLPVDTEYLDAMIWMTAAKLAPQFADVGSTRVQYIISHAAELEGDMLAASRPAFYSFLPDYD